MTELQGPWPPPGPTSASWFSGALQGPHALESLDPTLSGPQLFHTGVRAKQRDKTSFHSEHLLWIISVFTLCFLLHPSTELRNASSKNTGRVVDFEEEGDITVSLWLSF